jgi:hypothetical protein
MRVITGSSTHRDRKMIHNKQNAAIRTSKKGKVNPRRAINHHWCGGRNALQHASKKRTEATIFKVMKSRLVNFLKTGVMFKITNVRLLTPFSISLFLLLSGICSPED